MVNFNKYSHQGFSVSIYNNSKLPFAAVQINEAVGKRI